MQDNDKRIINQSQGEIINVPILWHTNKVYSYNNTFFISWKILRAKRSINQSAGKIIKIKWLQLNTFTNIFKALWNLSKETHIFWTVPVMFAKNMHCQGK